MGRKEALSESYFYILLCLSQGDNHGYGIMQMSKELSGGAVCIGPGTMYGATQNMLEKGWIREVMSEEPGQERRRLYQLCDSGRQALQAEKERLRRMLRDAGEE